MITTTVTTINKRGGGVTMNSINKIKSLPQWVFQAFYLSLYDLITVNFAYFIVLWLHYNLRYTTIPLKYLQAYLSFVPVYSEVQQKS